MRLRQYYRIQIETIYKDKFKIKQILNDKIKKNKKKSRGHAKKRRSLIIHYSYKQWRCWVEISILLGPICFMKSDFLKIFMYLFTFRKTDQWIIFFSKRKFGLVFRKVFFFLFWAENTFQKLWKIQNILLFVDYIKFHHQSFDCYIFCFESFFSISSHQTWFNLIFISILVLIFFIVVWFSLIILFIEDFYLLYLFHILLIAIYFYLK
jgi:hypothetical protein